MITIPEKYFAVFEKIGSKKIYEPDELVFMSEDKADSIYLIESGRVRVYIPGIEGKEATLAVLKKGRIFGDASFVADSLRTVNIESVVRTEVVTVNTKDMIPLLHESEELMVLMFQHLTETVNNLTHQIGRMVYCSAEQKIADLILSLTNENSSYVTYSHDNIAGSLGMNRVTVTKTLRRFREQGYIETGYGKIKVLDRKALGLLVPKDSMYFTAGRSDVSK